MAKELQQGRITVEFVFETTRSNYERTKGFVISSAKGCLKTGKNSNFHVEVFDEHGKSRGGDSTGDPYDPSPEMVRMIEEVIAEYHDDPPEVATA
jgi:hypothetical protein